MMLRYWMILTAVTAWAPVWGEIPDAIEHETVFETELKNRLFRPVWLGENPAVPGHFFVLEQHYGRIVVISPDNSGGYDKTEILRLDVARHGETGLLGLAFHPDFKNNRKYYLNYNPREGDLKTVIEERTVTEDYLDDSGEPGKLILEFSQPETNHNGGDIQFGPDGYLYIAVGDGGGGGDRHGTIGNSQDVSNLHGNMLRIDVDKKDPGLNYSIPADNPFADSDDSEVRKEIWAYGLRNPWRFSWDAHTGEMWVGDVGQNTFEEIAIVKEGENHGWRLMEGEACFNPSEGCYDAENLTLPIMSLPRGIARSITGGYVYRGDPESPYYGVYIFGDYVTRRLFGITKSGETVSRFADWGVHDYKPSSFAQDLKGDIYMIDYNGIIRKFILGDSKLDVSHQPAGIIGAVTFKIRGPAGYFTFGPNHSVSELTIFNTLGIPVRTLPVRHNRAVWDLKDNSGQDLTEGIYFTSLGNRNRRLIVKTALFR